MNARHHADVLVLGYSLPCALAATLLARRGANVLWLGTPPPAQWSLGGARVHSGPSLFPPLAHVPALRAVLAELALETEVHRLIQPTTLQLLGPRRRLTFPDDAPQVSGAAQALLTLRQWAPAAAEPSEAGASFGWMGTRALLRSEAAFAEDPATLGDPAAGLARGLDLLLDGTLDRRRSLVQLAALPHALPGGIARLVELLHRRYGEVGGRHLPAALSMPAEELRPGLGGVTCVLGSGDTVGARHLVLGMGAEERERLLPLGTSFGGRRLAARLPTREQEAELIRLTLVVGDAGLPAPFGPVAVLEGARPLLVERRPLAAGLSELAIFWRSEGDPAGEGAEALSRLEELLPFMQSFVRGRSDPAPVPGLARVDQAPVAHPVYRVNVALPGTGGLGGVDGAARIADALARRLSPSAGGRKSLRPSTTPPPARRLGSGTARSGSGPPRG